LSFTSSAPRPGKPPKCFPSSSSATLLVTQLDLDATTLSRTFATAASEILDYHLLNCRELSAGEVLADVDVGLSSRGEANVVAHVREADRDQLGDYMSELARALCLDLGETVLNCFPDPSFP
jgi:hypothetical protein